jgi:hypothetical protein
MSSSSESSSNTPNVDFNKVLASSYEIQNVASKIEPLMAKPNSDVPKELLQEFGNAVSKACVSFVSLTH